VERLINCDIIIDIELIEMISGANQCFEVVVSKKNKVKQKIIFDNAW
jgi:hypothetical protein